MTWLMCGPSPPSPKRSSIYICTCIRTAEGFPYHLWSGGGGGGGMFCMVAWEGPGRVVEDDDDNDNEEEVVVGNGTC